MLYYTSLIYFVPRKPELCYSSGPFTGPQQFHSMSDLKAPLINIQHGLIQLFMLYESELGPNTMEAAKNI